MLSPSTPSSTSTASSVNISSGLEDTSIENRLVRSDIVPRAYESNQVLSLNGESKKQINQKYAEDSKAFRFTDDFSKQ